MVDTQIKNSVAERLANTSYVMQECQIYLISKTVILMFAHILIKMSLETVHLTVGNPLSDANSGAEFITGVRRSRQNHDISLYCMAQCHFHLTTWITDSEPGYSYAQL